MTNNIRLAIGIAVPILLTAGVDQVADRAIGQRSAQLTLLLIVLLSTLTLARVLDLRRQQREKDQSGPRSADLTKREKLAASLAGVVLLGSVAFVVVRQVVVETSCRHPAVRVFSDLPYECDIDWKTLDESQINVETDSGGKRTVPIYKKRQPVADENNPKDGTVDFLSRQSGTRQFFACDVEDEQSTKFGGLSVNGTAHWALTRGDKNDVWGWVPEVFLQRGHDGDGDELIRDCTETEQALGGQRYKALSEL